MSEPAPALVAVLETAIYYPHEARDATLDLYERTLGLSRVTGWDDGTAFRCGAGVLLLFDRELLAARDEPIADHAAEGAGHVCLQAGPGTYDAWRDRLLAGGVEVTHEEEWPEGGRSLYFRDPAGNLLEIADSDLWPAA